MPVFDRRALGSACAVGKDTDGGSTMGKGYGRLLRRAGAIALALVLLAGTFAPGADASGFTKKTTTRAIAIVFDNSGSMYSSGSKAWSQATYAIEVFAAMLNDGDTLQVYPMWEITAGGESYSSDSPLVISGAGEAQVVRSIRTEEAGGTPIESVVSAHDGLLRLDADEHWLIVLTDGSTFSEGDEDMTVDGTRERLSELLGGYANDVNVLYLGIGNITPPSAESTSGYTYYAATATSERVPSALSGMCNLIFGRDELQVSNGQLSFDIPLSKLIVFVQGEDITDITLNGPSGTVSPVSTYSPMYSTEGAGNYKSVYDTSLTGMIATYADCPAGEYSIGFSGTSRSIAAYYEPDVDLAVTLTDSEGNIVSAGSQMYPGTYTLSYAMVDRDGNVTRSPLLGSTDYVINYTVNGEERTETASEPGSVQVELGEGDTLDVAASATFLGGYRISRSGRDLGWGDLGLEVMARPAGELAMQVSGGAGTYGLSELESKGVYSIALSYNGAALTADELERADVKASLSGGNAGYELSRTDGGYELRLKYAGSAPETDCGEYSLELSASYVNEFGQTAAAAPQTTAFTVEDETGTLALDLDVPQSYYVISKIAEGEPIYAYLTMDGVPLTEEQMADVVFSAEADGVELVTERIPGEAGYTVKIDGTGKPSPGTYKINASATALDPVGRETSDSASAKVELQNYPLWMRIALIVLITLITALLIWAFLNTKVLPKKVLVKKTTFTVDGEKVAGSANCVYAGGGKHKGSLEITSPRYSANPLVKGGFRLEVEAISPRRTRSRARAMRVRNVSAINAGAVNSIKVGAAQFVKDQTTGKFVRSGSKANAPVDFQISGRPNCNVVAEVMDGDGGSVAVSLVVGLEYR